MNQLRVSSIVVSTLEHPAANLTPAASVLILLPLESLRYLHTYIHVYRSKCQDVSSLYELHSTRQQPVARYTVAVAVAVAYYGGP